MIGFHGKRKLGNFKTLWRSMAFTHLCRWACVIFPMRWIMRAKIRILDWEGFMQHNNHVHWLNLKHLVWEKKFSFYYAFILCKLLHSNIIALQMPARFSPCLQMASFIVYHWDEHLWIVWGYNQIKNKKDHRRIHGKLYGEMSLVI